MRLALDIASALAAALRAGRRGEAEAVMARFRNADDYVLPTCFAIFHAANGDADALFGAYDEIIADPRFGELLKRINLLD